MSTDTGPTRRQITFHVVVFTLQSWIVLSSEVTVFWWISLPFWLFMARVTYCVISAAETAHEVEILKEKIKNLENKNR